MSEDAMKKLRETEARREEDLAEKAAKVDLAITIAARAAYEVNRAYRHHLGDPALSPWDEAESWRQHSMRAGVAALVKDPSVTPQQQHSIWLAHKKADGWTWGNLEDVEAKTHPYVIPYDELSPEQQFKDVLFQTVVRTVLSLEAL